MKFINAAVIPSKLASLDLRARRAYENLATAVIKRQERRKSRRQLSAELDAMCYDGVHRDFGKAPTFPAVQPVRKDQAHLVRLEPQFLLDPAKPQQLKPVVVTRKRAFTRTVTEIVMVPA